MDDYYLNLLAWGHHSIIAVALRQSVYLWHAADGKIIKLLTLDAESNTSLINTSDSYVTSVSWAPTDQVLAVGTSNHTVQLWDTVALTLIRILPGHTNRVSSMSWNTNSFISSGSRDSTILNHDIRLASNIVSTFHGHQQEVCGLAWSPDGSTLASGGNENLLCIWDAAYSGISSHTHGRGVNSSAELSSRGGGPRFSIDQHTAAVKAVSWCPWSRYTLASGGGTADRTIR
jgi:cell division cycle protein 20 (cofactor of APC complex)